MQLYRPRNMCHEDLITPIAEGYLASLSVYDATILYICLYSIGAALSNIYKSPIAIVISSIE